MHPVIKCNSDLLLVLKLIEVFHPKPKDRKKILIKLARRTFGTINASINHILNVRDYSKELNELIESANELAYVIGDFRHYGATGFAVVEDEYFPIIVDIRSNEDKEHALSNEELIVETVRTNLSRHPGISGKRATAIMFKEDGFSGTPFRFTVPRSR